MLPVLTFVIKANVCEALMARAPSFLVNISLTPSEAMRGTSSAAAITTGVNATLLGRQFSFRDGARQNEACKQPQVLRCHCFCQEDA